MLAALLGRKIGMTQVYDDDGRLLPVTVVQGGPCDVLQVKTPEIDGYNAVQIGLGDAKPHRATQCQIGHAGRAGVAPKQVVREVRLEEQPDVEAGQQLTVEQFEGVQWVDVIGTSKGKGFAGGMKRHGFSGQRASHGVKRVHRKPGSIASHASNAGTGPKPKKGKRMAGHMGSRRCTTRHHRLVRVDKENNLLLIQGAVPGAKQSPVLVRISKTKKAT
ncbi:MAG: 50S ribosomal protein L3 [Phycisphaerae bacterium]|nr:50S ribosomal protein L3 [Phycisphaerae bacterium]